MNINQNIIKFVSRSNWVMFFVISMIGLILSPPDFAVGIIFGGLIVTVNFHLLSRTLKKALTPSHLSSHRVILAKYYIRFFISGLIIFVLIKEHIVNPIGLFIGLSVVVASITLATLCELMKLIFKEAV